MWQRFRMDSLQDYVPVLTTTAALINGFIAVMIANFFKDRPRAKAILAASAGFVCLIALAATFYGQHTITATRDAERRHNIEVRERLGYFIAEGDALMDECGHLGTPLPTEKTQDWSNRAEAFLAEQLGRSYVVRFRDQTGVPSMGLNEGEPARKGLWHAIYARVLRLQEFSSEVPRAVVISAHT
jgi:hypothetical protein